MNKVDKIEKSIVFISDEESKSRYFGTGFVIRHVSGHSYILTCAHVIKSLGDIAKISVEGRHAVVVASGEEDSLDLAILKVSGLHEKPELSLKVSGKTGTEFITVGFQKFSNMHLVRPIEGKLGDPVSLQSFGIGERIKAWDLLIIDGNTLQPGYSGSPVVDKQTNEVLGIVSYRQGEGKKGLAISIEAVKNIWKFIDADQLYRSLLKLGYSKQIRLFKQLIKKHSIAALLIYGFPDYGQRWLLNLLISKHLPYLLTSRVIKVSLNRRGRRFDSKGIWRELSRHLELPANSSVKDIILNVYECWKTQNLILIFHQVNWMSKNSIKELIQDFWLPLSEDVKKCFKYNEETNKLLMFLIDYEGSIGGLEDFFPEKLNSINQNYQLIKSTKINEFSEDDLLSWLEKESDELPSELIEEIDETVEKIMESSESGIPELTLEEICYLCGFNWYEESEKWLIY